MENITNMAELKLKIQQLENKQSSEIQGLKEQFQNTYESLKPINLIKNSIEEIISTPISTDNVSGSLIGVASGYLTKKIVTGKSNNLFRNVFGTLLQLGVTNVISKHPDAVKSASDFLYQYILNKIQPESEADDESRQ